MKIDFTPLVRPYFLKVAGRTQSWKGNTERIQRRILESHLRKAQDTKYGKAHGFSDILSGGDIYEEFRKSVPTVHYEDIRPQVLEMVKGEKDI